MDFFLVLCVFVVAILMFFGSLIFSRLLAPHRPNPQKNAPYECGEKQIGPAWINFNVGYYLFALLFLAFDVEAAFLYPWAVIVREAGVPGLIEMGIFVFVLVLGLVYAWRKGALEWV
jgi:NADH-quinone oxidoreductase subunit A